jgi:hypothetical protein
MARVTRLAELFTLGSFLKNTEVRKFLSAFFHGKSYVSILTRKWSGLRFG